MANAMTPENFDEAVERLLERPFCVIDFLPMRVPEERAGRYFEAEAFFLAQPRRGELYRKFADILIRLNCYYDLAVTDGTRWDVNIPLRDLYEKVENCAGCEFVNILIEEENSLITLYSGDLYMTVYNPSEGLIGLIRDLASAQGLFVRRGING